MSTITIDTHELVKELINSGFSQEQAEGVTHAVRSIDLSHLATKGDIAELRQEILELRRDIKEVELRLTIKLGAIVVAALGFFQVMDKFF